MVQMVEDLPAMQETWVQSLGHLKLKKNKYCQYISRLYPFNYLVNLFKLRLKFSKIILLSLCI